MNSFFEYKKNVKPKPLIYPENNGNKITNVLLIDSNVKNYQTFVDSVNSYTFPIVYSNMSSKTELLTLLQTNFTSISRIGIVFNSSLENVKTFLDGKPLFLNSETEPYSENLQFIINVINEFQVKNIDYLACNTLNYQNWVNYYQLLTQSTGVVIGASNDKTGNIKYGGDWIMESTSQNVELVYFTKSIEYYHYLLDNPLNIQTLKIIWNDDPTVYALLTLDIANKTNGFYFAPFFPNWIYAFTLYIQESIFNLSDFQVFILSYDSQIDYTESNLKPQFDELNFAGDESSPNAINFFVFYYNNSQYTVSNIFLVNMVCFKEDTLILTNKGYKPIQDLRKGDLVKTLKHGYKAIDMIGKREIYHPALQERIKDQLYKCSQENYPEIVEPLIITGCHSILVDKFTDEEQKQKVIEVNGNTYVTDGKYRLPACADPRASVYEIKGNYTIYHLALENDDYYMNYGICANGLLVETCSKRYLKELSNMTLIE
jgi:hypothetical protein